LAKLDLKTFARRGAEARLAELNQEIKAIHSAFPDLRPGRLRQGSSAVASASAQSPRRRKSMSAAQRKAVSERMRKYWAARRADSTTKKR